MKSTPKPCLTPRTSVSYLGQVGYECNQVGRDSETGEEYDIPINAAYNHHHGSTLMSSVSQY